MLLGESPIAKYVLTQGFFQCPKCQSNNIYSVCHGRGSRREPRPCKFRQLFNINESLGLLELDDIVLNLINPSPGHVMLRLSFIAQLMGLKAFLVLFTHTQYVTTYSFEGFFLEIWIWMCITVMGHFIWQNGVVHTIITTIFQAKMTLKVITVLACLRIHKLSHD